MSDDKNRTNGRDAEGLAGIEGDELERAKQRLQEAGQNVAEQSIAFARRHPYVCTGAALAVGLVVGRVPYLRKAVLVGGSWAAKRALQHYAKGK